MWKFTGQQRPKFAQETSAGQESVWDYPRPPVCREDHREIVVRQGENLVARTSSAIRVLETASPPTVYIPPADVNLESLVSTQGSSFCEWKGEASYWSLKTATGLLKNVAWSYEHPSAAFQVLRGFYSFYPGMLLCTIDGERVRAQPGGFYGGWVTDEIAGPFKGEPGTLGW